MRRLSSLLPWAALSLAILSSYPARASDPSVAGAVNAAVSPTDFEVNGVHIVCNTHTKFELLRPTDAGRVSWSQKPYIGEPLVIYGHHDGHVHLIRANRVVFAPVEGRLRGTGVIDRMLAPQPAGSLLIRADGYPILLTPSTQITFVTPLKSLADIGTNVWLEYQGYQRADGQLIAEKASLRPNIIEQREEKLRGKYDYDPTAVPAGSHQNSAARLVAGADPKQIPPSPDKAMQARIDAIGQKLVPAYQRALADDDPSKIPFRFQLVEKKYAANRIDLPNGTILVPQEAIARLQNDDQIAAYLADGIAAILEKQQLRDALQKRLLTVEEIGGMNWIAPGLLAAAKKDDLVRAESEQRIRVSLALMHDAGYNLAEAPQTYWLLSSKEPKPLSDIEMPDESIYAYVAIGSTWRDTSLTSSPP